MTTKVLNESPGHTIAPIFDEGDEGMAALRRSTQDHRRASAA